jgi:hypothetical protein
MWIYNKLSYSRQWKGENTSEAVFIMDAVNSNFCHSERQMNRIKKRITVRFFSIRANDSFFDDFISIHNANQANEKNVRIINIREKKYLIKIHEALPHQNNRVFFLSVVRERNTWQVRALADGTISGIPLNQGIMGDPYYFFVEPKDKIILGFTTGMSGSLKGIANSTLQQFSKDRTTKVTLEPVSNEREFSRLKELSGYNKLYFKVDTTSLDEPNEGVPELLRQLNAVPFMANNSEIALTITEIGGDGFSESKLVEIVSYLSEYDGCSALTVHGVDNEGVKVHLDFSKTYAIFKTDIEIRDKFVDETEAKKILFNALSSFDRSTITNA